LGGGLGQNPVGDLLVLARVRRSLFGKVPTSGVLGRKLRKEILKRGPLSVSRVLLRVGLEEQDLVLRKLRRLGLGLGRPDLEQLDRNHRGPIKIAAE